MESKEKITKIGIFHIVRFLDDHISNIKNELCEICQFWLFLLLISQDLSELKQNQPKNRKSVEKRRSYGGINILAQIV